MAVVEVVYSGSVSLHFGRYLVHVVSERREFTDPAMEDKVQEEYRHENHHEK
jgi:hypothetical protein